MDKSTCLAGDRNLFAVLQPNWTLFTVRIIEDDGHAGFGDAGLTALVDEILLVLGAHLDGDVTR